MGGFSRMFCILLLIFLFAKAYICFATYQE